MSKVVVERVKMWITQQKIRHLQKNLLKNVYKKIKTCIIKTEIEDIGEFMLQEWKNTLDFKPDFVKKLEIMGVFPNHIIWVERKKINNISIDNVFDMMGNEGIGCVIMNRYNQEYVVYFKEGL